MRYTNTMTTAPEYIYHNTPQIDDVLLRLIKRVAKTGALTSTPVSYTHLTLPTTERV